MSIFTAVSPRVCYETPLIQWGQAVARPSRELFMENLNRALQQKGMRPSQLATAIGVDRSVVHAWIKGKAHPEQRYYDRIADALEMPVAHLFLDMTDVRNSGLVADQAFSAIQKIAEDWTRITGLQATMMIPPPGKTMEMRFDPPEEKPQRPRKRRVKKT